MLIVSGAVSYMYLEIEAVIADLKRRVDCEKSLKNRLLLEKALDALYDYQKQTALKH